MKYLLLVDFKSVKKLLIIYYTIILLVTVVIYPIAGWIGILFIIKIERDICKSNAIMELPKLYKNFPDKNLYPDEKNLLFYLVISGAFILWGISCFFIKVEDFALLSDKLRLILGLSMFGMSICNVYHISWLHFFFKYGDTQKCRQIISKFYIILAFSVVFLTKNDYVYKKLGRIFEFSCQTCIILTAINIILTLFSYIIARKSYEKSEVFK